MRFLYLVAQGASDITGSISNAAENTSDAAGSTTAAETGKKAKNA